MQLERTLGNPYAHDYQLLIKNILNAPIYYDPNQEIVYRGEKQSNNGSNSTTKNDSTQSFESKFTEEPQSNLDSSDSGQQYTAYKKTTITLTAATITE